MSVDKEKKDTSYFKAEMILNAAIIGVVVSFVALMVNIDAVKGWFGLGSDDDVKRFVGFFSVGAIALAALISVLGAFLAFLDFRRRADPRERGPALEQISILQKAYVGALLQSPLNPSLRGGASNGEPVAADQSNRGVSNSSPANRS
jgi:hypothetical protein